MKLVGKGNANIVLEDTNDNSPIKRLYRISTRYNTIVENNDYTLRNWNYIEQRIKPLLMDYLCGMELYNMTRDKLYNVQEVQTLLQSSDDLIKCIKMEDLRLPAEDGGASASKNITRYKDHYLKIYTTTSDILFELKPKWLYSVSVGYCRTCTHATMIKRNFLICPCLLVTDPAEAVERICSSSLNIYHKQLTEYFKDPSNILQCLYRLQQKWDPIRQLRHQSPIDLNTLCTAMTLRDVTIFIRSSISGQIAARIVDVDLKPKSKLEHWLATQNKLDTLPDASKVIHIKKNKPRSNLLLP
ncbi:hypothetical protein TBLA_0A03060 [Henningerozyma blattae CBS 6284]|uniref:Inositol-pentakisphosphate 2-kinase n=1 Tax=Henningerozyma blattae (strain ATCC 34711 / CBS 6284 / DSM 70876 / NBRC 10599 / NRRL Y-10934 / UCD 77-7) TaxID=1071380 RepID=I2GVF4_HENB6|nr:hypothetical protein TBLA_0A03060 [Tetrapisispora blattae CBS 6284]CCH58106.1 hypothetical protein TBLA_0A03060 [Tetrapisispora blattae CBS 6284]